MGDHETARTEFPLECTVDIKFDASDITTNLDPLQVVDLVREIDEELSDWAATLLAYHYFRGQYELALSEVPEYASLSVAELEAKIADSIAEAA